METLTEDIPTTFSFDKTYSIEEYLEIEERSSEKHYFIDGKIFKMPGAKFTHNLIATNITTALNIALEAKNLDYSVLNSDMKIYIPRIVSFVYPDAVVICEAPQYYNNRQDIILNPLLIVEVLSSSTATHDRTGKFHDYKQIPSFKEYVLVEQNIPFVTASFRVAERLWEDVEADNFESSIYLKSIDSSIALKRIYKGVKF